jgi:HrpA-like RNA helicase
MKAESEPELRRVPLEEVCMSILASGFSDNCLQFLSQAPQPPSIDSVRAAVDVLHQMGAVTVTADNEKERLTPLGLHLAKLPVDARIGKMMIFGVLFCCIEPVLTIAASLSSKSPFAEYFHDDGTAKAKQRQFMDPDSDFISYINVWKAYSKAAEASVSAVGKFCKKNYLNFVALREISDARRQYLDLLCSIGFLDKSDAAELQQSAFNRHANKYELVHAVCAAGLYPNIARLDQSPTINISLWHNTERIYFHGKSTNAAKKRFQSSDKWLVFHEKFGTTHRTFVATTAFVHPFVLCLFGGSVVVKHTERRVVVDGWMDLSMAAQVGVFLREIRKQLDLILEKVFQQGDKKEIKMMDHDMIEGIVSILSP